MWMITQVTQVLGMSRKSIIRKFCCCKDMYVCSQWNLTCLVIVICDLQFDVILQYMVHLSSWFKPQIYQESDC